MNCVTRFIAVACVLMITACGQDDPPFEAPQNVTVSAGENLVVVDWDVVAGHTYWVYYKEGSSVSQDVKDRTLYNVSPPYLVTGLTNDIQYAFSVTATIGTSPAGPFSPALTATPRLLSPAIAWFEGTSLTVNDLRSIAYGANTYVITGDAATLFVGSYSYTEDSGVSSWQAPTSITLTTSTNLTAVVYDGTQFVALGDDGSVIKNSATDSLTWTAATAISGAPAMNALAIGAGKYVAVGDAGAIYTNTSAGVTLDWTAQTSGTTNNLQGIAYVNNQFIAVGETGTLLSSPDGITWTTLTSNTANTLRQVAYGADNYVAVGDAGTIVSSADGISWTEQTPPTGESFRSIVFGIDAQFIAVGTTGTLAYSTTGAEGSWAIANAGVIDLNSIARNAVFIAVGAAGANVSGK
jgi:hypothetical protein